jgi:diaminohydroxyphosphoribosylaminopyrimidine deaminase/5-amino-6-(5-phosphoribosylamino)uracil reductase
MSANPAEGLMRRAIKLSISGYPAPNPRVGCVIAKDGVVVGEGFHEHAGGPHAEVVALTAAGGNALGADVYVTLEPCNHSGRTGPCSEALIEAGVRSVFYAIADPNPKHSTRPGATRLREAGIEVHEGLLAAQAETANIVWLTAMRRKRPYVTLKAAVTSDGFMARVDGTSKWITGAEARAKGHELRAQMGAVLIGAGTVRADDPQLTARIPGVMNQPVRIILDAAGDLPESAKVFAGSGEVLHVVAAARKDGQVAVPIGEGGFDLVLLLDELWDRGVTSILVEGGPTTLRHFLNRRIFDRLDLFVASTVFGEGKAFASAEELATSGLVLAQTRQIGPDVWNTYFPDLAVF